MSISFALLATECLVGWAVGWQTLELLTLNQNDELEAVYDWGILKNELPSPRWIFKRNPFTILLTLRLLAAVLLPSAHFVDASLNLVIPVFLLWSSAAVSLRWRGTFNGGSDYMIFLVLLGLSIGRIAGSETRIAMVGLGYVAVQTILSYLMAGLAKVRDRSWRTGEAFARLLISPNYIVPVRLHQLSRHPLICFILAWLTMIFECSSPLVILGPQSCLIFIGIAMAFHLANVYVLGLNHFFWAWLAAYPALYYFVTNFNVFLV